MLGNLGVTLKLETCDKFWILATFSHNDYGHVGDCDVLEVIASNHQYVVKVTKVQAHVRRMQPDIYLAMGRRILGKSIKWYKETRMSLQNWCSTPSIQT